MIQKLTSCDPTRGHVIILIRIKVIIFVGTNIVGVCNSVLLWWWVGNMERVSRKVAILEEGVTMWLEEREVDCQWTAGYESNVQQEERLFRHPRVMFAVLVGSVSGLGKEKKQPQQWLLWRWVG